MLKFKNGVELRRHLDQLCKRAYTGSETDEWDVSFPGVTSQRAIVDASPTSLPISGPRRSTRIYKPDIYF